MALLPITPSRAEAYRVAASELLAEANARGDCDDATIAFAVTFLLRRADVIKQAPVVVPPASCEKLAGVIQDLVCETFNQQARLASKRERTR